MDNIVSLLDNLPDDELAVYERGRKYRREMTRKSHEESAEQLETLLQSPHVTADVKKFVENTLALHKEVLDEFESPQHVYYKQMLLLKLEDTLEKRLLKHSEDWERLRAHTAQLIQLRYGDYFKQNVFAIRTIAKEDTTEEANFIIANKPWKEISDAIRKEEKSGWKDGGVRAHLGKIAKKTTMSPELAEYNVHQYADRNRLAHNGIDECISSMSWSELAEQIYMDKTWLLENSFAATACNKDQVLASVQAFQERFFKAMFVERHPISGILKARYAIPTDEVQKKMAMRATKIADMETEKKGQTGYLDIVDVARTTPEDHWYGPLRTAREELLDAHTQAEEAKILVEVLQKQLCQAQGTLRKHDMERKKKATSFAKALKVSEDVASEGAA
ncbi:hypothetical protein HYFRA_00009292 [Hymenoscyphus fraxineus]|uniref:Uncharacterized protein n=1 Tax=Hymenoscyphus fraxineus TaxID=746836 RepID=A0A9N9L1V5_9HELO|nr:hypothetical protein HYFRA_00009292 [Hymenoscyphus fraxineus]